MEEKKDIGIKHLAHEHLLILNQNYIGKEGDVCSGCREQIDSCKSFVYSCSNITSTGTTSTSGVTNLCDNFLLHKTCAELSPEIENPSHKNEFLTFQSIPKIYHNHDSLRYEFPCMLCSLPWRWFSYGSTSHNSFVCFKCALFLFQQSRKDPKIEHPGHTHPLALIEHPSSFKCYACKVYDNILDLSYRCTECQFWIHKSCGDAPPSFQIQFHKHPLVLFFSLPEVYHRFAQHCRLCKETLNRLEWLYCCHNCRFFTHFHCARSRTLLSEYKTYPHLVHLPSTDEISLNLLLEQLVNNYITPHKRNNQNYILTANEIMHWSHDEHVLKLITSNELYERKHDDGIVLLCEGCVRPIPTDDDGLSYYGCVPCKYFMHKGCAELPKETEHHLWPGKTLFANKYSQPFKLFYCQGCQVPSNGIFYGDSMIPSDRNSTIRLHIGCVTLPKFIKHEAHHHQLHQVHADRACTACRRPFEWMHGCTKCNFYICGGCTTKARTYKHRWHPHPLNLIYDAGKVDEHVHDFECEYCSEEIDTNTWFYHCSKWDLSFHPRCLEKSSYRDYQNVKFGATDIIRDKLHPHGLTFILNKKVRSCEKCGKESLGEPVLQCAPCNTVFCMSCSSY